MQSDLFYPKKIGENVRKKKQYARKSLKKFLTRH